jgi:branched-chain amino acid aminotransferase
MLVFSAMGFTSVGKVWMNGSLVDWADAKIHIASHVVHYASGVFEGARCYRTPRGSACFRLDAHIRRLYAAVLDTIRANPFEACYIRPLIYRGYEALGVNPFPNPVDAAILLWEWGPYLGGNALEEGVDVRVSSWTRISPNTLPATAKSAANYANSQLIKMEAIVEGYSEGLALDAMGFLSEGSGQNVFLVRDGLLYTPPIVASILPGITRDSVITIARDLGYQVREEPIPREMLYLADEVFFAGTAVEITPIRSIDKMEIGNGRRGPVTETIQRSFFEIVNGEVPDTHGWLTYVHPRKTSERAAAAEPARAGPR